MYLHGGGNVLTTIITTNFLRACLCLFVPSDLNDEMPPSQQLVAHQQWAIEDDPDHPTWQVVTGMTEGYMPSSDIFGVDNYPIGYIGGKFAVTCKNSTTAWIA